MKAGATAVQRFGQPRTGGRRAFGWMLVFIGSVAFLFGLIAFASLEPEAQLGGLIIGGPGGLLLAGGIGLVRSARRIETTHAWRSREQAVIDVAANNGGTVTVAQIMHEAKLSAVDAAEALAELCKQGVAEPELLDDGGVEYRFNGLTRLS